MQDTSTPRATAMILAAGRGNRMRPLSDQTPKPLLRVRGKPLIAWHLEALARAGTRQVVINTAWLEDDIPAELGDGSRWGLRIHYSMEGRDYGGALDVGGGVATALPLLDATFWLISADIFAPDFRFSQSVLDKLAKQAESSASPRFAQLWLVHNPDHAQGDFTLDSKGIAHPVQGNDAADAKRLSFASLGAFRRELFAGLTPGQSASLAGPLFDAARAGKIGATLWEGLWHNVGTPEQLAAMQS